MGSGENRREFLRQNNHTVKCSVQWRQNSHAERVISQARLSLLLVRVWLMRLPSMVKTETELYLRTKHPHSTHTHTLVWVGWIAEASEASTLGSWVTHPLSVLPSVSMSHPWNKYQKPCKPCTKQDTCMKIPLTPQGHFVPGLYHKTVWGMSSLKTSSLSGFGTK